MQAAVEARRCDARLLACTAWVAAPHDIACEGAGRHVGLRSHLLRLEPVPQPAVEIVVGGGSLSSASREWGGGRRGGRGPRGGSVPTAATSSCGALVAEEAATCFALALARAVGTEPAGKGAGDLLEGREALGHAEGKVLHRLLFPTAAPHARPELAHVVVHHSRLVRRGARATPVVVPAAAEVSTVHVVSEGRGGRGGLDKDSWP
mmetsp:Transcript_19482/g.52441  ORF Transcript_19482/g.52441 Transcript_19482/m.52441 type:complete len:206 (+) Transcript_19482:1139-1756(+)